MAKILLVNPSYKNSYGGSIGSLVNPIFPVLSLASLAAVARLDGHEIKLLDLSWRNYDSCFIKEEIFQFGPDVVGFSVLTPSMKQVSDMTFAIKEVSKNILCIGGGPHVSALPAESLRESLLDVIVIGEGEFTFREILRGCNLHNIQGIAFRQGEEIKINSARPPLENLDLLPLPAWDLFDHSFYQKHTSKLFAKKSPFVSAEFSRGCIYRCDFCASKLTMSFGYRKKSPERCAEEVRYMSKLGIREFMLTDDIFTTDMNWAKKVCEALIKNNNKVQWSCTNGIRVESSDRDLFNMMKRAGCYRIAFGFESGSDRVLKEFGKGGRATIERGVKAVKDARSSGLETIGFFQVGLSSDDEKSIYETVEFARKLPLDLMKFGVTIAFPGTAMFSEYKKKNIIKSFNWDHYHIYSGFNLFTHPRLTYEQIDKCITYAYRKTTFLNPGFVLRKLKNSLLKGEFLIYVNYFLKYVFLSYTKKKHQTNYEYLKGDQERQDVVLPG